MNISKRTLQYYRNSGILPYTTIRNKCYYKPEDVKAVFDRSTTKQK
ncbi:helix-turn-helix domain-containing protein [Alistipes timonensis]